VSLREIQERFAGGILSDDLSRVSAHVRPGRFGVERHLQIYRNNVYVSLTEALQAIYPVVARLVGEDCFRGCAYGYLRATPPTSGNLHDFGDAFDQFLSTFEPVRELGYLPDIARLEWSWHCAFHAGDGGPMALEKLAGVPAERYGALNFQLHPSARLLASDYPILRIWEANQPDGDVSDSIDLGEGGARLLIVRRGISVTIETLGAGEYALLDAFANGKPLADAAEAAAGADSEFDLTASLRERVLDQTIVGFNSN